MTTRRPRSPTLKITHVRHPYATRTRSVASSNGGAIKECPRMRSPWRPSSIENLIHVFCNTTTTVIGVSVPTATVAAQLTITTELLLDRPLSSRGFVADHSVGKGSRHNTQSTWRTRNPSSNCNTPIYCSTRRPRFCTRSLPGYSSTIPRLPAYSRSTNRS